jgi:hypothetical protein
VGVVRCIPREEGGGFLGVLGDVGGIVVDYALGVGRVVDCFEGKGHGHQIEDDGERECEEGKDPRWP